MLFSIGKQNKMFKTFLEAIMYSLRREQQQQQPVMPTGPNPMPPLTDFEVKKTRYQCNLHIPFGRFAVDIDMQEGVGFFEHAFNGVCGQFWLSGHRLVASDHILPGDVRHALKLACIEVA